MEQRQYETATQAADAVKKWAWQARARNEDLSRFVVLIDSERALVTMFKRREFNKHRLATSEFRQVIARAKSPMELVICSYDSEWYVVHVLTTLKASDFHLKHEGVQ